MTERPWYRLSRAAARATGARPPTENEQANADAYGAKLEGLLALSGGSTVELAAFLWELAGVLGIKRWANRPGAVRAVMQCLNGHPMLDWGYDIVDAAIEFLNQEAGK